MMRSSYNSAAMKAPAFEVSDRPVRIVAPQSNGKANLAPVHKGQVKTGRFVIRIQDGKAVVVTPALVDLPKIKIAG